MKTIKIYYKIVFILVGLLFVGCKQEEVTQLLSDSPTQTSGVQAFIYNSTPTTQVYTPDLTQTLQINFGRHNETAAASFSLQSSDPDGVFTVPSTVSFEAGQTENVVSIPFNMTIGTTHTLTLVIPQDDRYWYGQDSIVITVTRDYTWLDMGTVSFTSSWAGATADLSIQKTKETNIYRILSPYYHLEPDYCPEPGYHLYFTLDDNYNAVSFYKLQEIGETSSTGATIYMYGFNGNSFTNVGNTYTVVATYVYINASGSYSGWGGITESFVWTEGYPGNN